MGEHYSNVLPPPLLPNLPIFEKWDCSKRGLPSGTGFFRLILRPAPSDSDLVHEIFAVRHGGDPQLVVVAFGGDISALHDDMISQGSRWARYSLEGLAIILSERFPGADVMLVRPAEMRRLHGADFSIYSNLVDGLGPCGDIGKAGFVPGHAGERLMAVLGAAGLATERWPSLVLVSFSKGGVVLNQLLAEAAGCAGPLFERCEALHLVDHGVSTGVSGAYLAPARASDAVAAVAKRMRGGALRLWLHGSPRQWADCQRPWIRDEALALVAALREHGVEPEVRDYFPDSQGSLTEHFGLLEVFELDGQIQALASVPASIVAL